MVVRQIPPGEKAGGLLRPPLSSKGLPLRVRWKVQIHMITRNPQGSTTRWREPTFAPKSQGVTPSTNSTQHS